MREGYDLSKLKKRAGKTKVDRNANKVTITIRLNASDLVGVKDEADRMGLPYQTLVGSILHRYVIRELIDRREVS